MSIVTCSECGKEISSLATSCPSCGKPLNNSPQQPIQEVKISRGEMTDKKWKRIKLISWIVIMISLILMASDKQNPHGLSFWLGANFIIFSVIGLIISKIGAWWSHG